MVETAADRDCADAWLYAVLADQKLTAGAKTVAALLRLHFNPSAGVSSPSVQGLAVRTGQTERAVEKQRKTLRDAGLLTWEARPGRVRNDYRLIITPNVRRELARINPEHSAGVESASNPEHSAGVTKANPEQRFGQPRTAVPPTPNTGRGKPFKPIKPLGGDTPRAPDGAALAARLGDAGRCLRHRMGDAAFVTWLGEADFGPGGTITVPRPLFENYYRSTLRPHLDAAFPQGWTVAVRSKEAAHAA